MAEVEILDVGLVDRIIRQRSWEIQDDGRAVVRNQSQQHPIPENIMAQLAEHIGDGQAKVTVGAELAHSKDYGCKAQAFVSVSVTCNNNEADIAAVHDITHPMVKALVNQDLKEMMQDRDSYLAPPPAQGKVTHRPGAKPAPVRASPKSDATPGKPQPVRPKFRR